METSRSGSSTPYEDHYAEQEKHSMRWEYSVQTLNADEAFAKGQVVPRELQDVLNRKGREGWELVSTFETKSGREGSRLIVLTFKRPMDLESDSPVRAG